MQPAKRPLLVGLTGGIAAGKSTVAAMLREHGIVTLHADAIAHDVLHEETVIQALVHRLGSGILQGGHIDRRRLGEIVFAQDDARSYLNSIVHPRVRAKLDSAVVTSPAGVLVIEIPLLFENALEDRFDAVVTVEADVQRRVQALMRRNGLNRAQAQARLRTQLSEEQRTARATRTLRNPMDMDGLRHEVTELLAWLRTLQKRDVKCFTG